MKTKKQIQESVQHKQTARNVVFILGWIFLSLIVGFILIGLVEYSKIWELSILLFTMFIGYILYKILNKEKKE